MSALIFYLDEDQVFVATDTLAVNIDGSAHSYCSKAIHIPHLRTIIAGTGLGSFAVDWAMFANSSMLVRGIEHLDFHTPDKLRERWDISKTEHSLPSELTTTVYQFGLSEDTGRTCGYAYRSSNNFISEQLEYGYGRKPECKFLDGENFIENITLMMKEQRTIQETKGQNERLYIGGECYGVHLTKDRCETFRVFQFDDWKQQQDEMFENFE